MSSPAQHIQDSWNEFKAQLKDKGATEIHIEICFICFLEGITAASGHLAMYHRAGETNLCKAGLNLTVASIDLKL